MAMWTVIGAQTDGELLVFGAIEGKHVVEGDLCYHDYEPYADYVEADCAQEAMEKVGG